jgi:hypothetical protein
MGDAERQPFWKCSYTISPSAAYVAGVTLGCLLAIFCALTIPRDFSFGFLWPFLLIFGPLGGGIGYALGLSGDSVRQERMLQIASRVGLCAGLGLLAAFPVAWWRTAHSSPLLVIILIGGVCGLAIFAVCAAWGMADLAGQLVFSFRQCTKPGIKPRKDGVWDRDLE